MNVRDGVRLTRPLAGSLGTQLMANSYAMKVFASFYWSVHIAGVVILAADAVFKPRRPKREPGATTPKAAADGASTGTDSKKAD